MKMDLENPAGTKKHPLPTRDNVHLMIDQQKQMEMECHGSIVSLWLMAPTKSISATYWKAEGPPSGQNAMAYHNGINAVYHI